MKKVAILQSNYIPWKGYFDMIAAVDEFILYDDMQYTRRDWRNRNKIKTPKGLQWLTVPVMVKGKYHQLIKDTEIDGVDWQQSHWRTLESNYRRGAHFEEIASVLAPFYLERTYSHLSNLNRTLIDWACEFLGIKTRITSSSDYRLIDGKTERLLDLCRQAGASEYVSGPAAKGYLDETLFVDAGMDVSFFDYEGYSTYPQMWGAFEHGVTILDVIFNCGPDAARYLRYTTQ